MQEHESREQGDMSKTKKYMDKRAKSGCMNRKAEQQGNMKRGVMQKEGKGCMYEAKACQK